MHPDELTVSRKTPGDGRLEIPALLAERFRALGVPLRVHVADQTGVATIEAMSCSCAKSTARSHVHHFLVSAVLRELVPESRVRINVEGVPPGLVVQISR